MFLAKLSEAPRRKPQNLAEARDFIRTVYSRVTRPETVGIEACVGRCLAADIVAPLDLPRFDVAAMDGYAVRSSDLGSRQVSLRIVAEIAAGHPWPQQLEQGEAARIFTGALIPAGADRVIPQEYCDRNGDRFSFSLPLPGKPHIRLRGEDVRAGQKVLAAGTKIGPNHLALLRALQIGSISVLRRLRVVLLSVGDELLEVTSASDEGRIADSNRPMLRTWLEAIGCEVDDLGIVPDSAETLLTQLVDAAATADLIVTSGGASVGPADFMTNLIGRRGHLEFWKLAMRPGKPAGLGDIDDCPILALPGNPMAAAVAFTLIGRRLIARLSGDMSQLPLSLSLPLLRPIRKAGSFTQVLAARLSNSECGTRIEVLEKQGSASLMALAGAEGLALLPEDQTMFRAGSQVEFVRF